MCYGSVPVGVQIEGIHILSDRTREKGGILRQDRYLLTQQLQPYLADVDAIDCDSARVQL